MAMMTAIALPRLGAGWEQNPSYFTRLWNQTMTSIENAVNGIIVAQDAADQAQSSADAAAASASAAQTSADSANTAANAAQTTANTALTNANTALTNANAAQTTANNAQASADTKAPLNSPVFTGVPMAPTPAAADNSTKIATTAFVENELVPYLKTPGAWTAFTPTVTSQSGTITTVGAVIGRYQQVGKTVEIYLEIHITTNGTAGGWLIATIPVAPIYSPVLPGRESAVTGKMLQGQMLSSIPHIEIYYFDNSYPGADGAVLRVSGTYETT